MKRRNWLRWTAVVILLVASLIMIFNNQIKSYLVNGYRPQVTRQSIKKNQSKKGNYDFSNVKALNLQTVAKNRASKQNVNIIGTIAIPDIDMSIPIAKGVDNNTLALAAGTMREDQQMGKGNYALAGHNMAHGSKILFSPLYYHAKVGQKVYLTDLNKVYTYKITQREFIDADRVDVVDNTNDPIITLITCDATGARRLMIRGKLVKTQKFKNAPVKVQRALSSKYTNQ